MKALIGWLKSIFCKDNIKDTKDNINKPLFEYGFVYPSDRVGKYVDCIGTIVEVGEPLDIELVISMEVDIPIHGTYTGWATYTKHSRHLPQIGGVAVIRIYDAGGGWYPDNQILSYAPAKDRCILERAYGFSA